MSRFKSFRVFKENNKVVGQLMNSQAADLDAGELWVEVAYSSVNYKDALGITGQGDIFKKFPIIPGIDLAGTVVSSTDPRFKKGDKILTTGCGLGETHDGGYSQMMRVPASWAVPLPDGLLLKEAMIFGTAGFTAALAVHRMEQMGQTPALGKIVITGATGGVGSLAISILSRLGYEVCAVSGKPHMSAMLRDLGAHEVLTPAELGIGKKPMESVKWGGAIDNVGGELLAGLVKSTNLWGSVAAIGVAGGHSYPGTVFPHILRGVNILGISSANCPMSLRVVLWQKLASVFRPQALEKFVSATIGLSDLPRVSAEMIARQTHGRTLVDLAL